MKKSIAEQAAEDGYVPPKEAAKILQVSKSTIVRWCRKKRLNRIQVGSRWWVLIDTRARLLAESANLHVEKHRLKKQEAFAVIEGGKGPTHPRNQADSGQVSTINRLLLARQEAELQKLSKVYVMHDGFPPKDIAKMIRELMDDAIAIGWYRSRSYEEG